MKDYSNYSMEELGKMANVAFSEYYRLAIIPCGSQPPKWKLDRLQKAEDTYEEIRLEIVKRLEIDA